MAQVQQSQQGGKKRGMRIVLTMALAVALIAVLGMVLFNPAYSYYRKGMGQCVQWSNSYRLSATHLDTLISQDAALTKTSETNGKSQQPAIADDTLEQARRTLSAVQNQRDHVKAQKSANPIMACTTRQPTPKLNAETKREREWTNTLQRQIAVLNKAFAPVLVVKDVDPAATQIAQTELRSVAAGVAGFAKSQKATIDSVTLAQLNKATDQANNDVVKRASYSACKRDEDELYTAADKAVMAHNKAKGIDCGTQRCVALTFDDGPAPTLTPKLVNDLRSANATATFFEMGQKVQADGGALARTVAQAGLPVESHTWSHEDLPAIMQNHHEQQQINDTGNVIGSATGLPVNFVRPPHGTADEASRTFIGEQTGAAIAMYGVDSYDWSNGATSSSLTLKIMSQVEPGAIILMHDIHPHTVRAVPDVVSKLGRKGYRFVTIPELTGEYPRAGAVYYSRDDILRM